MSSYTQGESPTSLDMFFELGQEETASPFIIPRTRSWGSNLSLKSSILATFLLIVTFALSFYPTLVPLSHFFLVSVYFLVGIPALIESIETLATLEINIDVLMTLAAFSSVLIGSGMEGALLLVLFALSGAMEDAVTAKAKSAISSLHKLSPTKAVVEQPDGTLVEKALQEISVGMRILVKAGQIVPLDGTVIYGTSSVNLVHLTGENFPIRKEMHDTVPAGARNLEGALSLTVTRTSSDSTLARIIQLVTEAQEARPALQRWFDALSRGYALTIIGLAAFFALTLPLFLKLPFLGVEGSLYRALAFLIAASPCALIIAIPIAYLSAISICARKGVLLKGGTALDALASCSTIAFDKTGTLTTGDLTCEGILKLSDHEILPLSGEERNRILAITYAMEKNAMHPIAKALTAYAEAHKIKPVSLEHFRTVPGYGLEAKVEGREIFIGHPEYITSKLPENTHDALLKQTKKLQEEGKLLAVLFSGDNLYLYPFRDTPREKIKETLASLKITHNMQLIMLTGDHATSARRIADELNLDDYYADLRPEDKLAHVSRLSQERGLAMVGDGINDAPALARATVGISMGRMGSTTAIDASDIVLLQDNIEMLDWLVGKAQATEAVVKQNLILATCAIIFASIPALAGVVPLWLAVILHEGGTVLVGLNALRLLREGGAGPA